MLRPCVLQPMCVAMTETVTVLPNKSTACAIACLVFLALVAGALHVHDTAAFDSGGRLQSATEFLQAPECPACVPGHQVTEFNPTVQAGARTGTRRWPVALASLASRVRYLCNDSSPRAPPLFFS